MARKSDGSGSKPKPKNWQDTNAAILAALDLPAEFSSLGIETTGGQANADGWIACRAIGREDRNPSAAVNLTTGRYRDLGGDGLSLSLYDLAVQLGRFSDWRIAREAYAAKAGVTLDAKRDRDPAEHLKFNAAGPATNVLAKLFLDRHKPPCTLEAFLAAGGRIARYRDRYQVAALPVFGPALADADPVGWVLWQTNGRPLPVYHGAGPPSQVKMKTTGGSEAGMIGLHALTQITLPGLPSSSSSSVELIWKVEGPADLLALFTIIPPELRSRHVVVTNAGGANQNPQAWMEVIFAGRKVGVIGDADKAGVGGALKWAGWLTRHAAEVRYIAPELFGVGFEEVAESHGKDLRDWVIGKISTANNANKEHGEQG